MGQRHEELAVWEDGLVEDRRTVGRRKTDEQANQRRSKPWKRAKLGKKRMLLSRVTGRWSRLSREQWPQGREQITMEEQTNSRGEMNGLPGVTGPGHRNVATQ